MNAKTILIAIAIALAVAGTPILVAAPGGVKGKPGGGEDSAGNNLSFPVIWAEGVEKPLRGEVGMEPLLQGAWWYWWGTEGTDPDVVPLSCPPDPDDQTLCVDGNPPGTGWVKAYLQKDLNNVWQAGSANGSASLVYVDWIDWGDNLESVDWYTRSQVRTEVVLFKDLDPATPMTEYEMRHVDGWGINEVHGLAYDPYDQEVLEGPGVQATIYSPCARLTIQKLLVEREDPSLANLTWVPEMGWMGADLIKEPIFNMAVHEAGDGPGYYSAEINVKGRIIYGYTWNVRRLNDMEEVPPYTVPTAAGDYRITFSFDEACGGVSLVSLNTSLAQAEIIVPTEEELEAAEEVAATTPGYPAIQEADDGSDTGGAVAVLDTVNNLTYIDVRINERSAGKGGGNKGSGGKGR